MDEQKPKEHQTCLQKFDFEKYCSNPLFNVISEYRFMLINYFQ